MKTKNMKTEPMNHSIFPSSLRWVIVLALGYCLGQINSNGNLAVAQQRKQPERKAFLSGGERSELALEKMQKTLEQMDRRLMNIEKSTSDIAKRSAKK